MKSLLFIVPSLEAGAGGVADYALVLGAELEGRGWRVGWMSLQEVGLPRPMVREANRLRLRDWRRCDRAGVQSFVQEVGWDWISLQYVGYGFDVRGCPWGLGRWLNEVLPSGSRRHVMFHEIWTGAWNKAPWKLRIIGWWQRRCLLEMMRHWRPSVAHTSNATYQGVLGKAGCRVEVLPIFSNVVPCRFTQAERGRGDRIEFVLFGSVHPEWEPEALFRTLVRVGKRTGKPIAVTSVGRMGIGGQRWELWTRKYAGELTLRAEGGQPGERVSEILLRADYGIATTPVQVLGKSGSAAAMLEHGLPVIVTRQERYGLASDDAAPWDPMIIPMDDHLEDRLVAGVAKREVVRGVERVATEFIEALGRSGDR
jgi:hypothetical protein